MANLGSITPAGGATIEFAAAATPDGRIPERLIRILEPLNSDGVDGDRWLVSRRAFPTFSLTSLTAVATYDAGMTVSASAEDAIGLLATLTLIRRGTTYTYKNVLILPFPPPRITTGEVLGFGGLPGGLGVIIPWQLQLTEYRS
jgi:hypothetical protein